MSEDNLNKFLEFLFYQFHIPEKARRSSLTLNFKPGLRVVGFVSELEIKMQEHHHNMDITPAVAAPIHSTSKTAPPCHYCKQTGHLAFNCPRRKDSTKPNTQHRDGTSKRYTHTILTILTILEGHIFLLRGNQVSLTYMEHVHMTQINASQ